MRMPMRYTGVPVPSLGELLLVAGIGVSGWWGWTEYSRNYVRGRLSTPGISATDRIQSVEMWVAAGAGSVDELIPLLADDDAANRRDAARALGSIGRPAERAAPALARAIEDSDPKVRAGAILALARIGPYSPELSDQLKVAAADDAPLVREVASDAMKSLGAQVAPTLSTLLAHSKPAVRQEALRLVRDIARKSPEVVTAIQARVAAADDRETLISALVPALGDRNWSSIAGTLLAKVSDDESGRLVPMLAERLSSTNHETRSTALNALRGMDPTGVGAVSTMTALLSHESDSIAEFAATVLARSGSDAAGAVPEIVSQLRRRGPSSHLAMFLVETLGSIGPAAAPATPVLLEIVADPVYDVYLRALSISAIRRIGSSSVELVAPLRSVLLEDAPNLQAEALLALAALHPSEAKLLPEVLRALRSSGWHTRCTAAWTIGDIVGSRPEVVAALIGRLNDEASIVRWVAAKALGRLGPIASAALPALRSAVSAERNSESGTLSRFPMDSGNREQTVSEVIDEAIRAIAAEGGGS